LDGNVWASRGDGGHSLAPPSSRFHPLVVPAGLAVPGFPLEFTPYLIRGGNDDDGQGGGNGGLLRKSPHVAEIIIRKMVRKNLSFAESIPSLTLGAGSNRVSRVRQFSWSCWDDTSWWVAPQQSTV